MIAFHIESTAPHNASMHILSPMAQAITDLAKRKSGQKPGRPFIKADGVLNANALSDAMTEAGYPLPQPTISRILQGKGAEDSTVKTLADYFSVKEAVIRGEMGPLEGIELSAEARHLAQSFDEMPSSIRQFLWDVRDAWVRLKEGDPFLAEKLLERPKIT